MAYATWYRIDKVRECQSTEAVNYEVARTPGADACSAGSANRGWSNLAPCNRPVSSPDLFVAFIIPDVIMILQML